MLIGLGVGLARFVWQFSYSEPPCLKSYLDKRPALISKVHFLHFGIFLFLVTCIASWTISLLTPAIPDKYVKRIYLKEKNLKIFIKIFIKIRRLTYFTINDPEEPVPMEEEIKQEEKIQVKCLT